MSKVTSIPVHSEGKKKIGYLEKLVFSTIEPEGKKKLREWNMRLVVESRIKIYDAHIKFSKSHPNIWSGWDKKSGEPSGQDGADLTNFPSGWSASYTAGTAGTPASIDLHAPNDPNGAGYDPIKNLKDKNENDLSFLIPADWASFGDITVELTDMSGLVIGTSGSKDSFE